MGWMVAIDRQRATVDFLGAVMEWR